MDIRPTDLMRAFAAVEVAGVYLSVLHRMNSADYAADQWLVPMRGKEDRKCFVRCHADLFLRLRRVPMAYHVSSSAKGSDAAASQITDEAPQ